jgi:hypothetical protein
MQAVFSNLLAGLLLIQALTGWCDRSPLNCASSNADASSSIEDTACCQHDSCPAADTDSPADPCSGNGECHGICIYVSSPETRIDTTQMTLPIDFAAIVPASVDCHVVSSLALDSLWRSAISEPPLRLHLLHQIILI